MDSSPEFRQACEIRYILVLPDEKRTAFYLAVRKARGETAARELVAAVNAARRATVSKMERV